MNNHFTRSASRLSLLCLGIALVLYFWIGAANLELPGLQYDEAADAVPATEMLTGQPVSSLSTIDLLGRQFPVMMLHHIGPSTIYTSFAGMAVFGISAQALRLSQLLVGAISLILLWLGARSWFDPLTAAIAALLCATAPVFIWWNRAGANWTAPLLPLALGTFLLLRYWWRTRRPAALIGAAFLFGVGFVTKILFIWFAVPIVICTLIILGREGIRRTLASIHPTTLLLATVALLAGLSPFILHNVISPWATFRFLATNSLSTRIYGHNNLDIFNNLRRVGTEFVMAMGGDTIVFNAPTGLPIGAIAFVVCTVYLAAVCIKHRDHLPCGASSLAYPTLLPVGLRVRLFLIVCVATIIPLSTISTSSIGATYLFVLIPFAWLIIAIALRDGVIWLHTHIPPQQAILASVAVVGIMVFNHIGTNIAINQFMRETGGRGLWSDAIFTLARKLESQYADRPAIAMDWGFERSVTFLTQGRVHMREMYEYLPEPSAKFADTATVLLREPQNVYVFHSPEVTAFKGHWEVFTRSAAKQHKTLNPVETLYERSGAPNTVIYLAEDTPRNFAVSPTLATRNAIFDGGLTLLGGQVAYDATKREVAIALHWQSTADTQPDDTVLVHIVDQSNGNVAVVADQQPIYGSYPFPQWQRGEVVSDPHWVQLPDDLKPGVYQVRVGVYDRQTGVRRAISDPLNDATGNSLMLHSFEIK